MKVFKAARYIPVSMADLTPVAEDLEKHFQVQDFEVHKERTIAGGWRVDISKGGIFKGVLGLKSALSVEIEPSGNGTEVTAGVGIFGQQAIPAAISMFIFWPVLVTQIWGMVRQSKLDDEAIDVVERSLESFTKSSPGRATAVGLHAQSGARFCTNCGQSLVGQGKFCPECGAKLA
jgi:hypothetical protein